MKLRCPGCPPPQKMQPSILARPGSARCSKSCQSVSREGTSRQRPQCNPEQSESRSPILQEMHGTLVLAKIPRPRRSPFTLSQQTSRHKCLQEANPNALNPSELFVGLPLPRQVGRKAHFLREFPVYSPLTICRQCSTGVGYQEKRLLTISVKILENAVKITDVRRVARCWKKVRKSCLGAKRTADNKAR